LRRRSGHVVPRDELQNRVSNPPKTDQIKAIEVKGETDGTAERLRYDEQRSSGQGVDGISVVVKRDRSREEEEDAT